VSFTRGSRHPSVSDGILTGAILLPNAPSSATQRLSPQDAWIGWRWRWSETLRFCKAPSKPLCGKPISIDKKGIVAGAYKNVMTGDEQPVVGQLEFKSQRVAWHIGEVSTTVYETGLSNLENDVASVFVHFGEDQTQT
jgi:hypothetical protein